ncbi:hypothetical protein [Nocardia wallacei]|uniref:hypothetical protein n=1 Tax=Nocardia wallacei TaxID=480035 RepID=UPI0024575DAC|nr:hypothetical protein [Nocardia wallacei]
MSGKELLETVGVMFSGPVGEIEHANGWSTIGAVIVDDRKAVEVVPRHGVTLRHLDCLLAAAGRIWVHGLAGFGTDAWRYDARLGWITCVSCRDPRPVADEAAEYLARQGGGR